MKLTATITERRNKNAMRPHLSADLEDHEVATVELDGPPALVAGSLRALADEIDPNLRGFTAAKPLTGDFR